MVHATPGTIERQVRKRMVHRFRRFSQIFYFYTIPFFSTKPTGLAAQWIPEAISNLPGHYFNSFLHHPPNLSIQMPNIHSQLFLPYFHLFLSYFNSTKIVSPRQICLVSPIIGAGFVSCFLFLISRLSPLLNHHQPKLPHFSHIRYCHIKGLINRIGGTKQ